MGNLNTSINTGVGVHIGMNLPDDFGPPRILPSLPGSGYFKATADSGWYIFGGLDARYASKNLVLDAKSSTGKGVTRTPWEADLQYGIAYHQRNFRIAYTIVTLEKSKSKIPNRIASARFLLLG
jgi:lipid A 3-O-deacylase